MTSTTNTQPKTSSSAGIGMKLKGGVQVAKGLGDSVRGTTMGAIDTVEKRDSSLNDEIARRGRTEIENGIAMIKGHPVDTTAIGSQNANVNHNGPSNSLQGWGSGINGGNANATTNSAGFQPPRGQEYAQNSTTTNSNMKSDLGRGANAYSGNAEQPPQYPSPGGPPPQDYKGGMSYSNPTQQGNRPTTDAMVGEQGYQQRQDADRPMN
ncbi:hypothetical protein C8R44DRAFT_858229 [Mycena epipterygia]|nr:hypothetical protein C8R44DRAFT_858229 [Mycena epipterygia]